MKNYEVQYRLKEYVEREIEYWDFSGVIRIVKGGKTLWETSRGYSCVEFGVKNTMSTRFTGASVTKQFTAFAIMLLHDKGMLALDADANTYLPADMQIPSGITIHDLLAHAHGGDANGIAAYTQYFFEDDICIIILVL